MMIAPRVVDYELDFTSLTNRYTTDKIVIHHTGTSDYQGNYVDDDLSAEEIHEMHQRLGWAGIGYHFVVRKNGDIEVGRPLWSQGAHAQGENWHTVGIHVCGNFEVAMPTHEQIERLSYLVGWIAEKYDLPCTKGHIVGHCDLMPTACPGRNLYDILQTIRGKSIWYQQHYQGGD